MLFLIAFVALYIYLRQWFAEGFISAPSQANPEVLAIPEPNKAPIQATATFCPPGSKYFVNKRGDSMCCEGDIEHRKCNGTIVCTLSQPTAKYLSCGVILQQLQAKIATAYCPPSMPNYYVNEITGEKGCTASGLTTTGDGPVHMDASRCSIGISPVADLADRNSCLNHKRLEEFMCISPECSKHLDIRKNGHPAILTQSFVVPGGESLPRTCIDEHSMEIYLDSAEPNWRSSGKPDYNFESDIRYCATAKSSLIDKKYI